MSSVKQSFPARYLGLALLAAIIAAAGGCSKNQLTRFAPPGIIKYEEIASEKPPNPVVAERIAQHKARDDAKFPIISKTPAASVKISRKAFVSQEGLKEKQLSEERNRLQKLALKNKEFFGPLFAELAVHQDNIAFDETETQATPGPLKVEQTAQLSPQTTELSVADRLETKSKKQREAEIEELAAARNALLEQITIDRAAAEQDASEIDALTESRDDLSERLDRDSQTARRERAEPMPERQE